jgi:hypothetical protein
MRFLYNLLPIGATVIVRGRFRSSCLQGRPPAEPLADRASLDRTVANDISGRRGRFDLEAVLAARHG